MAQIKHRIIFPMLPDKDRDRYFMKKALEQAQKAGTKGEVPVGAVLVKEVKLRLELITSLFPAVTRPVMLKLSP